MGGKHSVNKNCASEVNVQKSNQNDIENSDPTEISLRIEVNSNSTNPKRSVCETRSRELIIAVAEANEHLFLENAKSHKARLNLSIRSLFATANNQTLSEKHKMLIRSTWKVAISKGKLKPGIIIFQNIFRRCPDLKELFRLSHIGDLDDLPNQDRFLRHANVFSDVIDLTVRNMDELDIQMAPALITLGRRHYYKHHVGFRPDYLAVFARAMIDFISEHLTDDKEALNGWWMITVYMVTKLQYGYALESMGRGKSKSKARN